MISRLLGVCITLASFSALSIAGLRIAYAAILALLAVAIITAKPVAMRAELPRSTLIAPWAVFSFFLLCGAGYDMFFVQSGQFAERMVLFDIATYGVIILTLACAERAISLGAVELAPMLNWLFISYFAVMAIFVAMFTAFGPLPFLSQGGVHFSPLVTNLHHTALGALVPLTLGLSALLYPLPFVSRRSAAAAVAIATISAYFSGSSKVLMGMGLLVAVVILVISYRAFAKKALLHISPATIALGSILAASILLPILHFAGYNIGGALGAVFTDLDTSDERRLIYTNTINRFSDSPIVGFGPGRQVWFGWRWWDAHSSVAAMLLQVGLLGTISVLLATWRWFSAIRADLPVLIVLAGFLTYGLFGDLHRNIPFWLAVVISVEISRRLPAPNSSQ